MSCSHVKRWVNLLTWLLIGCFYSCVANQEPACLLLTQLLTMTTTHKFPSLGDDGLVEEVPLLGKAVRVAVKQLRRPVHLPVVVEVTPVRPVLDSGQKLCMLVDEIKSNFMFFMKSHISS